jgi:hypothetical protein
MAVIQKALFERITDRMGKQVSMLSEAVESGMAASVVVGYEGDYYDALTTSNDSEVELNMGATAKSLDTNFTATNAITKLTWFSSLLTSLEAHLRGKGYTTMEAYCSGLSAKVCEEFDDFYYMIKGRRITATYVEDREIAL